MVRSADLATWISNIRQAARSLLPADAGRDSAQPAHLLVFMLAITASDLAAELLASPNGTVLIRPGEGLLLAMALVCRGTQFLATLVIGFAALAGTALVQDQPLLPALACAAARTLAAGFAAAWLRRRLGRSTDLTRRGILPAFGGIATGVAPAASALVVALFTAPRTGMLAGWRAEYIAEALGIALVAPLAVSLYREEVRELLDRPRLRETMLILSILTAAAALVFWQDRLPLLFLVYPPLLIVVTRLGFAGATIGVPWLALMAATATLNGHGPLQLVDGPTQDRTLVLQLYLATSAIMAFTIGVLIAEHRRLELGLVVRETRARFAEAQLRSSEQLHRLLSENASDIISRFDTNGHRRYVSPSVREILGWSEQDLYGEAWKERVHPDDRAAFQAAGDKMRRAEERISSTYRYARPDGSWAWIEARLRLVRDSSGEPKEYISNARDITQQKATEQALAVAMDELSVLATTDGLTGLPNRRRFDDTLRKEWRRAMRSGQMLALLMVDADNFKIYNDRYGHLQGDGCLRAIATCLATSTRRPGDLCARYGGEEFAVILPNTSLEGAIELAERIRVNVLGLARAHSGNPGGIVSVSIGVAAAVPLRHGHSAPLLTEADEALYLAKRSGRNRVATRHATAAPGPDPAIAGAAPLAGPQPASDTSVVQPLRPGPSGEPLHDPRFRPLVERA